MAAGDELPGAVPAAPDPVRLRRAVLAVGRDFEGALQQHDEHRAKMLADRVFQAAHPRHPEVHACARHVLREWEPLVVRHLCVEGRRSAEGKARRPAEGLSEPGRDRPGAWPQR
jgi:hypothetical protein